MEEILLDITEIIQHLGDTLDIEEDILMTHGVLVAGLVDLLHHLVDHHLEAHLVALILVDLLVVEEAPAAVELVEVFKEIECTDI